MRWNVTVIVGIAAGAAITSAAQSADFARRDSLNFGLKYECNTVPTASGWIESHSDGTNSPTATNGLLRVSSDVEEYLTFDNPDWYIATRQSYTMEIRYRTPDRGWMRLDVDDGDRRDILFVSTNAILWSIDGVLTPISASDTGTWNVVRFAAWTNKSERLVQVWHDGKSIYGPTNATDFSFGSKSLTFGDFWFDEETDSLIDYIRMNKGAALAPLLPYTAHLDVKQGNMVISFLSFTDLLYGVQSNTGLQTGEWVNINTTFTSSTADVGTISVALGAAQAACYYRVASVPSPPGDMAFIPSGRFVMGNATNVFPASEGHDYELPQHSVYVSAFYIDRYEVTKALWDDVASWAATKGYDISPSNGSGKDTNHPVQNVDWGEAAMWCNARSQKEGLTPVYYADADFTTVYTSYGIEPFANWEANGFRLPTEAEWEKAARGTAADARFPWTDYTNKISWAKANYFGWSEGLTYDLSGGSGAHHQTFATGGFPYTSPVGYFSPNGYGLYDMAGNVWEWCWDWYDLDYSISPATDPRGPAGPLTYRVLRGGSWDDSANATRCACRGFMAYGSARFDAIGFRCVREL